LFAEYDEFKEVVDVKRLLSILTIIIILSLSGCTNTKGIEKVGTYFYVGQSNSWVATYSITEAKSLYYDSLYIQYIDDIIDGNKIDEVGKIEYILTGNSMKMESSYPQELKGVGNFHTGA
jgi:hypothetical protein